MSDGGQFGNAVTAATAQLRSLDSEGRLDLLALGWDDLIELWGKRKVRTLRAIWDSTPADRREAQADLIADRAYSDPLRYHVARSFLADVIELGEPLPLALRKWAAQLILGTAQRPPSKRSDTRHKSRNRALTLGFLVHRIATDFSIAPTRGAASDPLSACDAVARAWSDHVGQLPKDRCRGLTVYSYERVKDFYYEAREIAQTENAQFRAFMDWLDSRPPAP